MNISSIMLIICVSALIIYLVFLNVTTNYIKRSKVIDLLFKYADDEHQCVSTSHGFNDFEVWINKNVKK